MDFRSACRLRLEDQAPSIAMVTHERWHIICVLQKLETICSYPVLMEISRKTKEKEREGERKGEREERKKREKKKERGRERKRRQIR